MIIRIADQFFRLFKTGKVDDIPCYNHVSLHNTKYIQLRINTNYIQF